MNYIFILIAYLLGSIPTALWIGQIFFHKDIRTMGSGNLGATNTFRCLGIPAGSIVMLIDILKGYLAVILPMTFIHVNAWHPLVFGVVVILGHVYPIFAKFKGGKAVAASAGMLLAFQPVIFLIAFITFVTTLLLIGYVSLSSILSAIAVIISTFIFSDNITKLFLILAALFVIWKHKANIIRILNHQEPHVPFWLFKNTFDKNKSNDN